MPWGMVCSLQLCARHEQFLGISLVLGSCLTCDVQNDIMTLENLQSVNLRAKAIILDRFMSQRLYEIIFSISYKLSPLHRHNKYCLKKFG